MTRPFRWSILGTGAVARKFALDLAQLDGAADAHVAASRNPDNARSFADGLGIPHALEYDAAVNADVDAVYIATPAALHEPQALAAIAAGKAVLIEKPMAGNAAAARRIAEAAKAANVFCMEAMWTRFQPAIETVLARIEAGVLGDPIGFDARFMIANQPDPAASIFDPDRDGGAMLHRGIYPLSLARLFLGPVLETDAMVRKGETGVDEDSLVTLRHANGAISSLRASLRANGPDGTVIYGTRATIYLDGPVYRPLGARLVPTHAARVTSGPAPRRTLEGFRDSRRGLRSIGALKGLLGAVKGTNRLPSAFRGNGYHYQARAVMEAVRAGTVTDKRMLPEDSIEILALIDQITSSGASS